MNKLYACMQQRGALFATIFMLLMAPLSMLTFGQSPCTSPVIREATNAKSTNGNLYDDIAIAMTDLLGTGTEAAWVMEPGATFTENPDGTAHLQGTVKQFGDYVTPRRLVMDVTLGGRSFSPDASGPYNQTGVATDSWYYYYTLSGTLTGLDAIAGGKLSLAIHMHPFQVGIGANQMFVTEDQLANGAGGWFEWTIDAQPTDPTLQFTNYVTGVTISDFAMLLSGTPSAPCVLNGSIGDQVYCDVNNNGIFDAGDIAATGLTVTLCDANSTPIATQTVDANGKYLFTNLPAGTYIVKFPETTLDGKPQRDLGNISVNLTEGQNYLDADKGYYKAPVLGTIGDQLYCDVNNNGIFDAGDIAVTGLTVTLCDANSTPIATQTVDADGKYLFTNLPAGTYIVKFPETTLDGKPQRDLGNISVDLTEGQNYLDADKGYYRPSVDPCSNDTEAPVLVNCPTDMTVTADCRTNEATATWTVPTATDNCSTANVVSSHTSGTKFSGSTVVSFTATDAAGNTATCEFNVIVNAAIDTEKPVFANCPTSILKDVVNSTSTCWTINWTAPTATDNCSTPVITSNYNSGDCFPAGLTVVTYTATDASGNTETCSFGVTITKTTSCSVTGNTITKSCVNNLPALTGSTLVGHEYLWLISTVSCPTQASQAIAGATAQNYNLPSRVVATTYFVRLARPIGCTTWNTINASNCITVNANECAPSDPCTGISSIRSVTNTYDYCGSRSGQPYVALFNNKYYTAGSDLKFTEYTNGTALLKGTIYTGGVAYWINMTFSGKTTVSSGSPKIELCAVGQTSGSSWYYYTTTGGEINTPTGTYSLTRQGPAFQVGQFANLQQNTYGASGWFYGNGSVPGDVNFNLGPIEACGTNNPCTGVGATVYKDCNYGGTAKSLSVGTYTMAQLIAMGISNDVLSAIKVNAGYKITLFADDNFAGQQLIRTTNDDCFINDNFDNKVSSIKVECGSAPVSCTVSGNTLTKSCVNNIPVITGTNLGNYEYVWLKSTTGCPTQSSQAIAGATAQNYSLPSRVTVTTYFVRCARPVGCTTWGTVNESNCITVYATDCQTTTTTCSINFSSTKSYRIVSKKSGKAIDVSGAGTYNDCPIIQWGYNGTANQQWRFFSLGSGYFKVMARNSGKYLACHYTSNGSSVYQYDYYSGGYKDWKIECVGNTGYYRLIHRASGKVLDVSGASTADGAKMQIYTWAGTDNQLFKIEEVTPAAGAYSLSSTALAMNATAESDRVRINWLSNTGYDNDFYTVEKMNASTGDFEKMALVNNTQFDDQVQTHVVNDVQPTEGDNFYRIKVTMNDGQEKLTDVKKVTFKRMVGFGAFPNPASDELNVNLSEYTGKAVDIVIYNTFGKAVLRQHVENVANATHSLNISEFAAGQYHIRVSSEGKRDATQPVVIQK